MHECYLCGAECDGAYNIYNRFICKDCFERTGVVLCEWCLEFCFKADPELVVWKEGKQERYMHRRCNDEQEMMERRRQK